MDMFWCVALMLLVSSLLNVRKSKGGDVLNREQTEEWKGWMQFMFLMYHYFSAHEVCDEERRAACVSRSIDVAKGGASLLRSARYFTKLRAGAKTCCLGSFSLILARVLRFLAGVQLDPRVHYGLRLDDRLR